MYRVSYDALAAAGMNMSGVNDSRFQIYFRGKEIPVLLNEKTPGSFASGDFIEFYGQRNDGALDSVLYYNPQDQPHKDYSIWTDTSAYFLTVGSNAGKRISRAKNTGASANKDFYIVESANYWHENFSNNTPMLPYTLNYNNSEYSEGMGWMSGGFAVNAGGGLPQSKTIDLYTGALNTSSSAPSPQLEFLVYGKNFAPSTPGDDHHIQIIIGPRGGSTRTIDRTFKAFAKVHDVISLNASDLGSDYTTVTIKAVGVTSASELDMVAYVKISYPKSFQYYAGGTLVADNFSVTNSAGTNDLSFDPLGSGATKYLQLYDITQGILSEEQTVTNTTATFNLSNPGRGTSDFFLFDTTFINNVSVIPVTFTKPDLSGVNYIVISSKALAGPCKTFTNYKESQKIDSFNNFKVLAEYAEDLYDQFFYGVHSAAAIQNFLAYVYRTDSTQLPKFILLLGKGIRNNQVRQYYSQDYVPNIGFPSSDLMYQEGITTGFKGREDAIRPLFAMGRLAITSEADLDNYLEKLKAVDSVYGKAIWMKKVVHVVGGEPADQAEMDQTMLNASDIISGPYSGASVTNYLSQSSDAVNKNLSGSIQGSLNDGCGLFTYLGHGSLNVLGVDIGDFSTLSNTNRYPIMYLNGCNVGDPSYPTLSMGEQYLFGKRKGAIDWISQSNTALAQAVEGQIRAFYKNTAQGLFAHTVGETWSKTIMDLRAISDQAGYLRSGTEQVVLQGDPSVKMPYMPRPDFATYDSSIFITPKTVVASSSSYSIGIPVYNLGMTWDGAIKAHVVHTLPDGLTRDSSDVTFLAPSYGDTAYVTFKRGAQKLQGLNKFDIIIDPDSIANEVSWTNNTAHFEYLFPGTGSRALIPEDFGIEFVDTPALVVQSRNLLDRTTGYIFEIDTTPYFNSPIMKTSPLLKGSSLMTWKPQLMVRNALGAVDSIVYYWRVRMNLPADSGGDWDTHSFVYIKKGQHGWSQSHFPQYRGISPEAVIMDTVNREFTFQQQYITYILSANAFTNSGLGIKLQGQGDMLYGNYNSPNVCMVEIDKTSLNPIDRDRITHKHYYTFDNYIPSTRPYDSTIAYLQFDLSTSTGQDSFVHSMNRVQNGNYVLLVSRKAEMNFKSWTAAVKSAFAMVGDTMIPNLRRDSTAFIIAGIKQPGKGILLNEKSLHYNTLDKTTKIEYDAVLSKPANDSGYITSITIGPAQQWKTLYQLYRPQEKPSKDSHFIEVYGIDSNANATLLYDSIRTSPFDISHVDARKYPYIRLRAELEDDSLKTPPQLKMWQATYTGVPEGSLMADQDYSFKSDTLVQGDSLKLRIKFKNVSNVAMKPMQVAFSITNAKNAELLSFSQQKGTFAALQPGEFFYIDKTFATTKMVGPCVLSVKVNPNYQQPELTLDNNIINIPVYVIADRANPILDVTVDGKHIQNGELVSPIPVITTTVRDENKILVLNDTADFKLTFKNVTAAKADTIRFSDKRISFKPGTSANDVAVITFKPGTLSAGTYEFSARATDRSHNVSGTAPSYTIFNVAPDAGISNLYVFPNPLTSTARFGYTLAGSQVPDYMELRIYNTQGRLVRTLTRTDMGTPGIGQNEFTWDGTSDGGAPLMQGIYFYKMIVQLNGKKVNSIDNAEGIQVGNGRLVIIH